MFFFLCLLFLTLMWVSSFFHILILSFLVEMWVGIGVVLFWVCEIMTLFFFLIGSIVSFRPLWVIASAFPTCEFVYCMFIISQPPHSVSRLGFPSLLSKKNIIFFYKVELFIKIFIITNLYFLYHN